MFDVMSKKAALLIGLAVAGCQPSNQGNLPGDASDTEPFSAIATNEALRFTGTEPFWGGEVSGSTLTYSTPENQDGTTIAVERFAGRGGLSFSGALDGKPFDLLVTQGQCSDGMSDRTFPFNATLRLGDETRIGCAWSDAHPFTGPQHP